MSRRRSASQGTLFPFVSVIICVIGALSFLIVATGVSSSYDQKIDHIHAGDPIIGDLAQAEQEQNAVQLRYEVILENLQDLEQEEQGLRISVARLEVTLEMLAAAREQEDLLHEEYTSIQNSLSAANALIDSISQRVRGRATEIDLLAELDGEFPYNPLFVECRSDGILILANHVHIPTGDIKESDYVGRLLTNIKNGESWCLFLLVRRGGVHSFDKVYLRARGTAPMGFHPIMSEGELAASKWPKPDWL